MTARRAADAVGPACAYSPRLRVHHGSLLLARRTRGVIPVNCGHAPALVSSSRSFAVHVFRGIDKATIEDDIAGDFRADLAVNTAAFGGTSQPHIVYELRATPGVERPSPRQQPGPRGSDSPWSRSRPRRDAVGDPADVQARFVQ